MELITKFARTGFTKIFAFTRSDGLNLIFSFLLGRVVFFDCMSPFALAFLAAYITNNPDSLVGATLISGAALFGTLSTGMGINLIKYILAFILFGLVYTAVTTISEKQTAFTSGTIAAVSLLISGVIFIGQWGITLYYAAMLVTECIICFSVSVFCGKALNYKSLGWEGVLGLLSLGALTVVGFGDIAVGTVSLGKVVAGVYILLIAFCGGTGGAAAAGIGVGVLYSFTTYPQTEAIGIFSICGLVCGVMSKYRRAGVIWGFVFANILLYVYLGSSSGSVLSVYDVAVTLTAFCLIPKSALMVAENVIQAALPRDRNAKKVIEDLYNKLMAVSEKAKEIAKEANIKLPRNKSDIMTIFDKAADKVCKRCGLRFVCWDKEFNLTYDQLLHHTPTLLKEGKIQKEKISPEFKNKCIHYESYMDEVNRLFARFNLDNMWVKKVEAGGQLVSQHIYGIAEIMEDLAKETGRSVDFIPNPDNVLYLAIKKRGIKCYNTSVIKTELGQHEVWVKAKAIDENVIADITSETLGRRFYIKDSKKDDKKITVHLLERERYNVKTGAAARTKDGSRKSGDSYCQKRLEHNRHLAILSDGMGSGENARSQSLYAVNVMLRLLNCGFNKECAIKIMNLSLFLRQSKESFATMDAAVIDLFEGSAEFIKIGASPSFIKRGGVVKKISSDTLPAGMITNITPYNKRMEIKKDDIIVLTSDGVCGCDDDWLIKYLADSKELNPQKLSENIIKEAIIRNDHTAKDDMTVITLQINEEIA